jgi:hypothetical protein
MTIRFVGPLLCGTSLLLALLTPVVAPAAPTTVSCSPTKVKIVASSLQNISKTVGDYSNIPEAAVAFTQAGPAASCVIVRFSTEAEVPGANNVAIRAFLDNASSAVPALIYYSGDNGGTRSAHSYEFVFPSVTPGAHTVRMQFSSTGGTIVTLHRHTTVVQFK